MTVLFSIGVTTYKRRDLLKECLSSILRQTFRDFEIIVGNDYPKEKLSGELLDLSDERIRFVNHPRNLGEMGNMNALLAEGRGRYFTWLADDDLYADTFLESIHATLSKHGFPPCVFTSYLSGASFPPGREVPVREGECLAGRQFLRLYLNRTLRLQGCYGVFETQYLRKIGGMTQLGVGFSPYSDQLLALRAACLPTIVYIDAPLIFYRTHDQSISWASTDLDAYTSAQERLCGEGIEIFSSEGLQADFQSSLFFLLCWCIRDFASVLLRSGGVDRRRVYAYLGFIRKHLRLLQGSTLYWRTIAFLGRVGCRLVWDIGWKQRGGQVAHTT